MLLAFHDTVLDRVTDTTGRIAESTYAEVQRALIKGSDRVPTLAELFDAFPEARFNIDLKAPAAVAPLARFLEEREAWDRVCVGSFSGRRLRRFRRLTGGPGRHLGIAGRGRGVPGAPRTRRPPAHPRPAPSAPGPPQARAPHHRHPRSRTTCAPGRRARARLDHRRPRRDEGSPGPWCRWPDDRPDGHTQGGAHRERPMEDTLNDDWSRAPNGIADLRPLWRSKDQKAWYWYDWANSAFYTTVLSVLFAPYMITVAGEGGRLRRPRRHVQQDGQPAGPRPRRRLAARSTSRASRPSPAPWCCRWSVRSWTGRRARSGTWAATPGRGRSSARCCSSCRARAGSSVPSRSCWPASSAAARWSATTRSWSTSRPRTSATTSPRAAGPSATSAAACCWRSTSRSTSATTRSGSARGWPCGSRCCRRPCGGPASRSSRWCACATTPRRTWSQPRARCSSAASVSSSPR